MSDSSRSSEFSSLQISSAAILKKSILLESTKPRKNLEFPIQFESFKWFPFESKVLIQKFRILRISADFLDKQGSQPVNEMSDF